MIYLPVTKPKAKYCLFIHYFDTSLQRRVFKPNIRPTRTLEWQSSNNDPHRRAQGRAMPVLVAAMAVRLGWFGSRNEAHVLATQ